MTYPIETALTGLNDVENMRPFSYNGLNQVTVIFRESANLYFMRRQVTKRLNQARASLSEGVDPVLGPVSTGLGGVVYYSIEYKYPRDEGAPTPAEDKAGQRKDGSFAADKDERLPDSVPQLAHLRAVQDWIVRP